MLFVINNCNSNFQKIDFFLHGLSNRVLNDEFDWLFGIIFLNNNLLLKYMAKSCKYTLIFILCCLFISVTEATISKRGNDRILESSVQSSDELGTFYYPVSLLKLPKDKKEVLKPLNTKDGET